jgi:hypothetical protein
MSVTVKITNDYSDGHHSEREVILPSPELPLTRPLDEWWDEVVYPETGDGHGIDGLGSCYTAEIIAADSESLLGRAYEWVD